MTGGDDLRMKTHRRSLLVLLFVGVSVISLEFYGQQALKERAVRQYRRELDNLIAQDKILRQIRETPATERAIEENRKQAAAVARQIEDLN